MSTLSRRSLLRVGGMTALGLLTHTALPSVARAHGDEDAETMEIAMGELYFRVEDGEANAPITLAAGERHMIRLHNEGASAHEIHFGRDANLEERIYRENLLGTEGEHGEHGFLAVVLQPGEATTVMFVIPETKRGEWEIGCFMPGHYEGGQHAPLVVT